MKKILVLSLIFLLVLQPVTFPATAFADEIDDELLSEIIHTESEDNSNEILPDDFDSSSEVVDLSEDKSSTTEFNTLNGETIDESDTSEDDSDEGIDQDIVDEPIDNKFIEDGQVYISRVYSKDGEEFIEIYNSGGDIRIDELTISQIVVSSGNANNIAYLKNGIFKSKSSILVIQNGRKISDNDYSYDALYSTTGNRIPSEAVIKISLNDVEFGFCSASVDNCNKYSLERSLAGGLDNQTFAEICLEREGSAEDCSESGAYKYIKKPIDQLATHYGGFIPDEIELEDDSESSTVIQPETPKNTCEAIRLNEIAANADGQFIEITNHSNDVADLLGCRIKTNRSKTRQYEFDEIELKPGEIYSFEVADSDLLLTKTTKGEVFLLNEDDEEIDFVAYENLKKDTSWSVFMGESEEWRQTYTPTPNEVNIYTQYPPCPVGQERNLATGRCRNTPVETEPAPCLPDQYRNPETGRCRKYATLASANLVPCKEGQYRHPETNRCRKIPTETELAPCKEGYERNPETNRCRKVVTNASANHSVEEVDLSEKQFTGWLIISGIGAVAIGVIIWEWRQELWLVALRVKNKIKYRSLRK